jgi:hypothetical protein
MPVSISLTGLFPNPVTVHAPTGDIKLSPQSQDSSFIVFHQTGMVEAAVHPFIRMVPPLGKAMAHSQLPLDKVEQVAAITSAICDMVEQGATAEKVLGLLLGAAPGNSGLQAGALVALHVQQALQDERVSASEVLQVLDDVGLGDKVIGLFR